MDKFIQTTTEDYLIDKFNKTTQSIQDLRVSPFLPLEKVMPNSSIMKEFIKNKQKLIRETPYGYLEIRNRLLTQKHLEILNVISYSSENIEVINNKIHLEVSIYKIAQELKLAWGIKTKQQIIDYIKDINDVVIYRKNGKKTESYKILDKVIYNEDTKKWNITYSIDYTKVLKNKIFINYDEVFKNIVNINGRGSGILKSVINFFITHNLAENKKMQISLDKLFETIGIQKTQYAKAKMFIKDNSELLSSYNISLNSTEKNLVFTGLKYINFMD